MKGQTLTLGYAPSSGPLATLAGVYQDVKGQRPEALWREAVLLWTDGLVEVLSVLLENPQLRPLAQASVSTLSVALDVVRNQHGGTFSSFVLARSIFSLCLI